MESRMWEIPTQHLTKTAADGLSGISCGILKNFAFYWVKNEGQKCLSLRFTSKDERPNTWQRAPKQHVSSTITDSTNYSQSYNKTRFHGLKDNELTKAVIWDVHLFHYPQRPPHSLGSPRPHLTLLERPPETMALITQKGERTESFPGKSGSGQRWLPLHLQPPQMKITKLQAAEELAVRGLVISVPCPSSHFIHESRQRSLTPFLSSLCGKCDISTLVQTLNIKKRKAITLQVLKERPNCREKINLLQK